MAKASDFVRNGLHGDSYITSDSDDESFVVLSRSLPAESLIEILNEEVNEPISTDIIQKSIDSATEAISELSSDKSEVTDKLLSLPKAIAYNAALNPDAVLNVADTTSSFCSNVSDLSPSEIQQKVESLIDENAKLKETLVQNNLAMKKQYETIAMWNEDVQKVHEAHKQKFAETKAYIDKLKLENSKLKENLQVAESTISCLSDEIGLMKGQDPNIKALNVELYKTTVENLNKFELEAAQMKITKLEEEMSKMQLVRESTQLTPQGKSENDDKVESLRKELEKVTAAKNELAQELSNEHKQSVVKQSRLIDEIEALKTNLAAKANFNEETITKMREQLMSSQIQITELQEERRKDKEIIQQLTPLQAQIAQFQDERKQDKETIKQLTAVQAELQEVVKKNAELLQEKESELSDYKNGLQSLRARVVDPVFITEKMERIEQLQKIVGELQAEVEVVPILKEQLEVYKTDFEAERQARRDEKAEKDSVKEDLGHLQRRNQQLLEEIERLRAGSAATRNVGNVLPQPTSSSTRNALPQVPSPPLQRFRCPMCMQSFRSLRFLEDHVDICLQSAD